MSVESVMPSNHLLLCHPLLLPSVFPSTRVFSNESTLHITWPKYWSFSFSISPSTEYSGLISFRIDRFDLLAVQGTIHLGLPVNPLFASDIQGPFLCSFLSRLRRGVDAFVSCFTRRREHKHHVYWERPFGIR